MNSSIINDYMYLLPPAIIITTIFFSKFLKTRIKSHKRKYCEIRLCNKIQILEQSEEELTAIPPQQVQWFFCSVKNQEIIKQIENRQLFNLTRVNISDNNITTIENLAQLSLSNLLYLQLNDNHICNTKSLRKIKSTNLNWIQIHNNPLVDTLQTTHEINMEDLQFIWVEQFSTDSLTQQQINWICKLQCPYLARIYLNNSTHIQQKKTQKIMINKFSTNFQFRTSNL